MLVRVSWVWFCSELFSWLLHINGNLGLPKQRGKRSLLVFLRGEDTNVFLFCRVTYCPQSYFGRFWCKPWTGCGSSWHAQLASEILEVTGNIHRCFHCTFSQFKAECVSICPKSFSVCLIMAWGCTSIQATSPCKHTSNPLCEGTARHSFWVCFCVWGTKRSVGGGLCAVFRLTFHFNTKRKAAYQMAQLGLTHGRASKPGATRAWPRLRPWDPQGWLHIMTTLCVLWNITIISIISISTANTGLTLCYSKYVRQFKFCAQK